MITLFDNWVIDVDSTSYTLKKMVQGKTKDGKDVMRDDIRGYYGTLEGALKGLGKEIVSDRLRDGSYTLAEALNVVREAREKVEKLIEEKAAV